MADARPGAATLRVTGPDAARVFRNEPGGHRFQRVPPNEKRGRVHTSTLTVAVLREPAASEWVLGAEDLQITRCRGSGAGGQHRNVTDSAVQVRHLPTGTTVRCEAERSAHQNEATAVALLRARLLAEREARAAAAENEARRRMVGSGMRGDKRRTYRWQDGTVTDHVLDVRLLLRDWARGEFGGLVA